MWILCVQEWGGVYGHIEREAGGQVEGFWSLCGVLRCQLGVSTLLPIPPLFPLFQYFSPVCRLVSFFVGPVLTIFFLIRLVYFFIYTVRIRGWSFGFGTLFGGLGKGVDVVKGLLSKKRRTRRRREPGGRDVEKA